MMPKKRPQKRNCSENEPNQEGSHPAGMSPLELLPTEILEMVVKRAMRNTKTVRLDNNDPNEPKKKFTTVSNGHNLLIGTIAKISTRFRTLASSRSLWKGEVFVSGGEKQIREVMEGFLSDGITALHLINLAEETVNILLPGLSSRPKRSKTVIQRTTISGDDITNIAARCPNLETLSIAAAKILA